MRVARTAVTAAAARAVESSRPDRLIDSAGLGPHGRQWVMFVHRLRVRYSECDQQGVVFNGHYLFYYDLAITELWRARVCSYREMIDKGDDLVVAESRLRFLRPARFDDEIDIAMNIHHLGTTSMVIRPEFRIGHTPIAAGEMRHVFVDPTTLVKKPIPEYVRTRLTSDSTQAGPSV